MSDEIRCPVCGSSTRLRTRREDGSKFHVCVNWPECKGKVDFEDEYEDDWDDKKPVSRTTQQRTPQRKVKKEDVAPKQTKPSLGVTILGIVIVIIVIACIIYFVVAPGNQETSTPGFETYTDNTNGFSISIPDGWEPNNLDSGINFISPSTCAGWHPYGVVAGTREGDYTSVQDYYDKVAEPFYEDVDGFALISKEYLIIDGITAIKVIYTYVDSLGNNAQEMGCFLFKQQTVWMIDGTCDITCWNTYGDTFNTMVNSFRVLD